MTHSIQGLPASKICELLNKLKSEGIDANITVGGIAVFPKDDKEIETAKKISEDFGATRFFKGETLTQSNMTLKNKQRKAFK